MKPIIFSQHAKDRLEGRGVSEEEVQRAIKEGESIPAKKGREAFRKNFCFDSEWKGKHYEVKQVMPIIIEEVSKIVVITVYAFYFGGENHEDQI